ncbi:hypothetical protein XELAEV_18024947mg, partial [Xenopus laevis]
YRKETATNSLLHVQSQHPRNTILGIPVGQYLQVKRLCSTTEEFKVEAKKLALGVERKSLLATKNKSTCHFNSNDKSIRLIGDFSMEHKEITGILNKHWHFLQQDRELSKGCFKCGNCMVCPFVLKTINIMKKIDHKHHNIEHFINCKTQGVIYIMQCGCGLEYVGKTIREFRRRIMEHVGIDKIHNTTRVGDLNRKLLQREAEWIYSMNTKAPHGLNEGFTYAPFL